MTAIKQLNSIEWSPAFGDDRRWRPLLCLAPAGDFPECLTGMVRYLQNERTTINENTRD